MLFHNQGRYYNSLNIASIGVTSPSERGVTTP